MTTHRVYDMTTRSFFPPIALDAGLDHPLYQQLYDWFQRAIVEGRLRAGQRVPSTRSLAAELKISRNPVLTAYEQLNAEGYLEISVGAGTCVARSIPEHAFKPDSVGVATLPLRHPRRPSRRADAMMPESSGTRPRAAGAFRTCDPAIGQFPTKVWSTLVARHAQNPAFELTAYGDPMGYAPLRESIAGYLGTVRAMRCDASQIMVVAGSQQGLQITAHALLDRGDAVWVEEPGYLRARRTLQMAGLEPREGHFARHIRRMRMLYMERCKTLTEALEVEMGGLFEVLNAEAGMHLTGLLPPGMDDVEVSRRAAEIELQITPLSTRYIEAPSRGGLILGYGVADTAQIRSGVRQLAQIVRSVAKDALDQVFTRSASLR